MHQYYSNVLAGWEPYGTCAVISSRLFPIKGALISQLHENYRMHNVICL